MLYASACNVFVSSFIYNIYALSPGAQRHALNQLYASDGREALLGFGKRHVRHGMATTLTAAVGRKKGGAMRADGKTSGVKCKACGQVSKQDITIVIEPEVLRCAVRWEGFTQYKGDRQHVGWLCKMSYS
jgi:hypothetical protein